MASSAAEGHTQRVPLNAGSYGAGALRAARFKIKRGESMI